MSLKGEIESVEPTRFERAVARRSAEIRATVPDAEFQTVVTLPAALGTQATADPPLAALVLAAAAKALRAVPRLNGAYKDGRYERYSRVNLGVTITGDGLYVIPTIFDSDTKATGELAAELAELKRRAAADELDSAELTGATFTVTDLSEHGVSAGAPLIVGGQAAGLAVGAVRAVPVVRDDQVVPGHELVLTLSVDHRLAQAPDAGRFLTAMREELGEAA